MVRNLATDADAVAAYDEPGSWGRLSEGWPETPWTPGKLLLCTKAEVVPYGQYVVVGSKLNKRLHKWDTTTPTYDYSEARIRVASVELLQKLLKAYEGMFVDCRNMIAEELKGDYPR